MSDRSRILLAQGIGAAKAGDLDEARFYLKWVLRTDASEEEAIRAWRWLAEISDDPAEKRKYLELILARQMGHPWARRELAILDGRLDPDEIVDPENLPDPEGRRDEVRGQRFACTECGGTMVFTPDGGALVCRYCGNRDVPEVDTDVPEEDFIVGLARASGHTRPVTVETFTCKSCGASFLLDSATISLTCPFCSSPYAVDVTETREIIPPTGIIPHVVTQVAAREAFLAWLADNTIQTRVHRVPPVGLYLPVWTFDVAGVIRYTYYETDDDSAFNERRRSIRRTGTRSIFYDDIVVPACRTLSSELVEELRAFDHDRLLPYDSRFLADWPAELYEITMAEASIRARAHVVQQERHRIAAKLGWGVRDVTLSSQDVHLDAYKLMLVPVWITHYRYADETYDVVINGQTGVVRGETPPRFGGRLRDVLSRLFD